jgi:hypothetical protein
MAIKKRGYGKRVLHGYQNKGDGRGSPYGIIMNSID